MVGVIAEILIAAFHPPYDSFWDQWGTSVANSLIAIGVALEIKFGQMAGLRQTELRRRSDEKVAAATDRATRAETSLIKLLTPRRAILRPHMERIAKDLERFQRTKFDIGFGSGGEQSNFCWDIEEMLAAAKWDEHGWGEITSSPIVVHNRGSSRPFAGIVSAENVEIHLDATWGPSLRPAATALISALRSIGIDAQEVPFNYNSANVEAIHIQIGPKA